VPRRQAETEAVRRFGPVTPIARATLRRSFAALTFEMLRAALFLAGCGLVAAGISGLVAVVMNLWFGRSFVGGVGFFADQRASINETADDAVVLRVIAGLVRLFASAPLALCCRPDNLSSACPVVDRCSPWRPAHISSSAQPVLAVEAARNETVRVHSSRRRVRLRVTCGDIAVWRTALT
jgi:hypothetical protein